MQGVCLRGSYFLQGTQETTQELTDRTVAFLDDGLTLRLSEKKRIRFGCLGTAH